MKSSVRSRCFGVILHALCLVTNLLNITPACAEETESAQAPATYAAPAATNKPVFGIRLRVDYDQREQGADRDRDLYTYFTGKANELGDGHLDIYSSAKLHTDFDVPVSSSLADDPFLGVTDTKAVSDDRLLQLYGDLHDKDRKLSLRAGRQYLDYVDYLRLDGAALSINENQAFGGSVYAGQPVSFNGSTSGDTAAGISLSGRPWDGNRSRFTLSRYYDDSEDGHDLNYYLDVRQKLSEQTRTRGQLSLLNEEFRMGQLDLFYSSEDGETGLNLGGSYWGSFDAKTRAYSPLYDVLGEQDPYSYSYIRLNQMLTPTLTLSPGASFRIVDGGTNTTYNRDYQNYDITLIYQPVRAFSASLALEHWNVNGGDSFSGITGELRYRYRRIWEISGGSSYAQYSYDSYSDFSYVANGGQTELTESGTTIQETPYVKTYFVRARWKVSRQLVLKARFDVEDDESATDIAYRGRVSVEVRY